MPTPSTIAIVGRPNVGKSTLFNRLAGRRLAVVHARAGVTRDRLVAKVEREGRRLWLVDTGGISLERDELSRATTESALAALEEAELLLFLTDVRTGVTDEDLAVAKLLRRRAERVWLLVNKVERAEDELALHEFHGLGLGEPLGLSALHGGGGIAELWERLLERVPPLPSSAQLERELRLAVVGRPNVGKSSLVNALLGEERMIVSEIPGTTRDAVDSPLRWHGREAVLIDTAGLRRKSRTKSRLDVYSSLRSLAAIDNANVVLLVLDASQPFTEQDQRIAAHAHEEGKGCVIAVNKWDRLEKDDQTLGAVLERVREGLPFLAYAPVLFISAVTRQRIHTVLEAAFRVFDKRGQRLGTGQLNSALERAVARRPPNHFNGGTARFYYATQTGAAPPSFTLFVNNPEWVHFSYRRYLTNQLRAHFDLEGSPLRLNLKARSRRELSA
ncbi:ribosome biogenesis GTPase Der [bacterium]|nr:ribosome biogenesis GTPase Der [bacterium]